MTTNAQAGDTHKWAVLTYLMTGGGGRCPRSLIFCHRNVWFGLLVNVNLIFKLSVLGPKRRRLVERGLFSVTWDFLTCVPFNGIDD